MEHKPGVYKFGRCTVIVTMDAGRWHLSISTPDCSPSYKELKHARYTYCPDNITMAQLFPPQAEFVNFHPYCHHLWQVIGVEHEPGKI
ncbi:MAG: hypothetical protein KAR39_13035 [Thermoplasmata archaeon]|nr:hypothetical protein [Thermoplasmata archaeon]